MTPATSRRRRAGGSVPRPGNHVIVMFGATGDLAQRKLLPGLFHLAAAGLMPDKYQIIGSSRRDLTDDQFREHARQAITEFGMSKPTGAAWQTFQRRLGFASAQPGATDSLAAAIERAIVKLTVGGYYVILNCKWYSFAVREHRNRTTVPSMPSLPQSHLVAGLR